MAARLAQASQYRAGINSYIMKLESLKPAISKVYIGLLIKEGVKKTTLEG